MLRCLNLGEKKGGGGIQVSKQVTLSIARVRAGRSCVLWIKRAIFELF